MGSDYITSGIIFAALASTAYNFWTFIQNLLKSKDQELALKDEVIKSKDEKIEKLFKLQDEMKERISSLEIKIAKVDTINDMAKLFENTLIKVLTPTLKSKK